MKTLFVCVWSLVGIAVLFVVVAYVVGSYQEYVRQARVVGAQQTQGAVSNSTSAAVTDISAQGFSAAQRNALRSASQYLSVQGFSRAGLIQQLSSDVGGGYAITDATVAVDSMNIDWNKEAVRSAKQYLDIQGFSCRGLIHQLSSTTGSGYTASQAIYAARQLGLCQQGAQADSTKSSESVPIQYAADVLSTVSECDGVFPRGTPKNQRISPKKSECEAANKALPDVMHAKLTGLN